jgi:uncharacterized membrane protein YdjX (TVP38/TMEM64 family)
MKKLIFLIFILILAFLISYFYLQEILNLDSLKQNVNWLMMWASKEIVLSRFVFFTSYIIFAGLSFPFLPGVLTVAAGALFGVVEGVILVSFASTLGACICFLLSRYFLADFVNNKFFKKKSVMIEKFNENGPWYLLSLRLIPTISFILINLVMGVLPISLKKFYYISQLGMLQATIVYVNAGSEISKVNNINDIMSFSLLLSFTLIAVFPFFTKWLMSYFNTRKKIKY